MSIELVDSTIACVGHILFVSIHALRSHEREGESHRLKFEDFEVQILALLDRSWRWKLDREFGEDTTS